MPPQFPPSYGDKNPTEPARPGQKIYVGNFSGGSWELSYTAPGRKIITVGTPVARVPKADGTHLLWDDPPSAGNVFAYSRKRDLIGDHADTETDDKLADIQPPRNASIQTDGPHPSFPAVGRLSRRSLLSGTSFLDARFYLDALSCPLEPDLEGCDDCSIQWPDGQVPTTTTSEPPPSYPTMPPAEGPYCFRDHNDDNQYASFSWDEYMEGQTKLCDQPQLYITTEASRFYGLPSGLYLQAGWARDQTGCATETAFNLTQDCESGMDTLMNCDGISNTEFYGGAFTHASENGCIQYDMGKLAQN